MIEFRNPSLDEVEQLVHVAHEMRSAFLKSLCARLWARLTGRSAAPVTPTYA